MRSMLKSLKDLRMAFLSVLGCTLNDIMTEDAMVSMIKSKHLIIAFKQK